MKLAWLSCLALLLSSPGGAATGGAVWLDEGLGARWLGMGGAARAAVRDVHAGYWNPAALSAIGAETFQVGSMLTLQSMGRSTASLSGSWQTDRAGTFAVNWLHHAVTGLERVDDQGTVTGGAGSAADALLVSAGWAPFYQLRAGVTAKLMRESIFDFSATGGAADAGFLVQPVLSEDFWIGLTVINAAGSMAWKGGGTDTPARSIGGGAAWRGWADRLLVAADAASRDGAVGFHAGAEFWAVPMAAVRAGWNDGRPSAGAAYLWKPYQLDYAFTFDPDTIGTRHQVSFLLHF